jgi:non-heme chloroperoxidase
MPGSATTRSIEGRVSARTVEAEHGARLWVVEMGRGPALVLVPGWTMAWTVFEHQIMELAETFRVIAFDPRGQGQSSTTFAGNSYRQHGHDLERVIEALGVGRFSLVGWSWGGFDAYEYLGLAGADRVDHLVVIDQPPCSFVSDLASTWGEFDLSSHREFLSEITEDRAGFADEFVGWLVARAPDARDRDWLRDMHLATTTTVAVTLAMDATFRDYTSIAEQIDGRIPVLQVVRDEDVSAARTWVNAHTPNAQVVTIRSHLGFWEDASAFNDLLGEFLAAG